MSWITKLQSPGHIGEALVHFNTATHKLKCEASSVEISRFFPMPLTKFKQNGCYMKIIQEGVKLKPFKL